VETVGDSGDQYSIFYCVQESIGVLYRLGYGLKRSLKLFPCKGWKGPRDSRVKLVFDYVSQTGKRKALPPFPSFLFLSYFFIGGLEASASTVISTPF